MSEKVNETLQKIPNWVYWAIAILGIFGAFIVILYYAWLKRKEK